MAILDGEYIDDKDIDPAKHKFIGIFRDPFSTYKDLHIVAFRCGCGEQLFNERSLFDHWQRGHMDAAQYVSIEKGGVAADSVTMKRHRCCSWLEKGSHAVIVCEETGGRISTGGSFVLKSGNWSIKVNYCPLCGKKAPKQIGE